MRSTESAWVNPLGATHVRALLHWLMVLSHLATILLASFDLIFGPRVRLSPITFIVVAVSATLLATISGFVDYAVSDIPSALLGYSRFFETSNLAFSKFSGFAMSLVLGMVLAYVAMYGAVDPDAPDGMHGDERMKRIVLWALCDVVAIFTSLLSITFIWALYVTAIRLRDDVHTERCKNTPPSLQQGNPTTECDATLPSPPSRAHERTGLLPVSPVDQLREGIRLRAPLDRK
jgi:hypothetical protein